MVISRLAASPGVVYFLRRATASFPFDVAAVFGQVCHMSHPDGLVHHLSPPESKIALFRSLFRGRDDVYPRRFESRKTGKSGYSPACGNEWVPGLCEKPRIKCALVRISTFLPVTDQVVRWHLSGHDDFGRDFVMGVYPLLRDETCFFLAADLDKAQWEEDAQAILETCRRLDLAGGPGAVALGPWRTHLAVFRRGDPGGAARKLGAHLLTETMESRPGIGLDSYDRFFPNQDTLPQGGFGNLIALPLQKRPRERGNSVFLDDCLLPHADQWAFLSSIRKIDRATVERIVAEAEKRGRVVGVRIAPADEDAAAPWAAPPSRRRTEPPLAGPLPDKLELVLADQIYIAKDRLPPGLCNRLVRLAAFQNPEFYKAQAMRLPTYDKPRIIACAEDLPQHIGLPRGCLDEIRELLSKSAHRRADARRTQRRQAAGREISGRVVPRAGDGRPRPAGPRHRRSCRHDRVWKDRRRRLADRPARGQYAGSGASPAIAGTMGRAIVGVSGAAPKAIGRIGGGRKKPTGSLDVAIIQSLVRKHVVSDLVGDYGHLIVDECHHLSAQSFEQVVRRSKAKFVTGLSATVTRKDGHHPIVFMQCGPVRHRVDAKAQAAARPFAHAVHVRPTGFRPTGALAEDVRIQFQELYSELIADKARNQLICDDVLEAVNEGRSPLVLTERNEHLDFLAEQLSPGIKHLIVLRGGMSEKRSGRRHRPARGHPRERAAGVCSRPAG